MTSVKSPAYIVPAACDHCGSLNSLVHTTKGLKSVAECNGRIYRQVLQHRRCEDCGKTFKIIAIQKNRSRSIKGRVDSGHETTKD